MANSQGKYQTAEEWIAENKGSVNDTEIIRKLEEIQIAIAKLQSSINEDSEKDIEATEEIRVNATIGSSEFPYQQAAVFSLAGMILGILLSFLIFRKVLKGVKKNYEARLSEARDSLANMIKLMAEKK